MPPETTPYWRQPIARVVFAYQPSSLESTESAVASLFDTGKDRKTMVLMRATTSVVFRAYPNRIAIPKVGTRRALVRFAEGKAFDISKITASPDVTIEIPPRIDKSYCWLVCQRSQSWEGLRNVRIEAIQDGKPYETSLIVESED